MAGNPFDFNRDGRWSVPERALSHYGIGPLLRGGGGGPARGCGCAMVLLALLVVGVAWLLVRGS